MHGFFLGICKPRKNSTIRTKIHLRGLDVDIIVSCFVVEIYEIK